MATLGDKVTDTVVGAVSKGVSGFTLAQHADLKGIIGPRIKSYIDSLPAGSPVRAELLHMTTSSTFSDALMTLLGMIFGLAGSIFALGEPIVESVRSEAWYTNPAKRLDIGAATKAYWWKSLSAEQWHDMLRRDGYYQDYHLALENSMRPGMPVDDVRDASLRGLITPEETFANLFRLGFTPKDITLMQQIWQLRPGVQDLIRMAVKEAFTPEIAEKFGQYADFPAEVTEYAKQIGLSPEWTQRYWAAHWDLPSVSQGFEMLHRGIIDDGTLKQLLRALDVMPYWRDLLVKMSFNPLTRVDVRRMYHLGVLDDAAVLKSYHDLGYDDANSQRLLEFTRLYYGPEDDDPEQVDRDLTKAEILDGYRKRILSREQATQALKLLAYDDIKIDFYLSREDLKADQARKDAYTERYHALYLNGNKSAVEATTALADLGLVRSEIDELVILWTMEKTSRTSEPSRTDLNRFLEKGIISENEYVDQMRLLGYNDSVLWWYLVDATS